MSVSSTYSIAPSVSPSTAQRHGLPSSSVSLTNSCDSAPAPCGQPGDAVFVQRALAGDTEALEKLLAHLRPRLYRIAFRVLRSKEDAEDAVQDALFSAYKNLASFEGRSLFSTWLTRIVVNAALVRRRHQRYRSELFIDDTPSSENQSLPMGIVDSHPDPEQNCAWNETRVVVEEALNDLAPAMRSAFRLREMDDLSNADAARASGVRIGAFKSRISRARNQLAARLEPSAIAPLQKYVPAASSWASSPSPDDSH
jgi:RNA polymerase sigma-70 factor, ECF subfamily